MKKTSEILEIEKDHIPSVLYELNAEKRIMIKEIEGFEYVWAMPLFMAEQGIVFEIFRLLDHPCSLREVDQKAALKWVSEQIKITFASAQKEAIILSLDQKTTNYYRGTWNRKKHDYKSNYSYYRKNFFSHCFSSPHWKGCEKNE